jgi:Bacteriophage tail sheath protein
VRLDVADTAAAAFVGSHVDDAARHFYANGGSRLHCVPVAGFDDDPEAAFARLDELDLSVVAAPGHAALEAGARYCERRGDCFFVADAPEGAGPAEVRGLAERVRSSYAALFVPWLNPESPAPPSGFVAGALAASPPWAARVALKGVTGLVQDLGEIDLGVNVLRGELEAARTLSRDPEWKYVSVRRTAIFLERSIDKGTQWAAFEPNEEPLWASLRRAISAFLESQWRLGAFQGAARHEAFFVTCDRTTMTQSDIDAGRVIVVVGFAPLKPAEFVVIRIGLWAARDEPDP